MDDAVSTILGALATAAGAGAGDVVRQTTKDALIEMRDRLSQSLREQLRGDKVGEGKLKVFEDQPTEGNGESLREHLLKAGVGEQSEAFDLARRILTQAGPSGIGPGSVAATIIHQIGSGHIGGIQNYYPTGTPPNPS